MMVQARRLNATNAEGVQEAVGEGHGGDVDDQDLRWKTVGVETSEDHRGTTGEGADE